MDSSVHSQANADIKPATIEPMYAGPALFCISCARALSFGLYPISRIHGLANSIGEYQRKPITMAEDSGNLNANLDDACASLCFF